MFSYNKTTLSLCVHPQGQSREIRICGATLLALPVFPRKLQSPSRRANTPLPCNGGFRPKLLEAPPHLPGPRRPTNLCPALTRFHCPGSLKMRCAGSLPPHRFDCIIHFICVKSRGNLKFSVRFFTLCHSMLSLFRISQTVSPNQNTPNAAAMPSVRAAQPMKPCAERVVWMLPASPTTV